MDIYEYIGLMGWPVDNGFLVLYNDKEASTKAAKSMGDLEKMIDSSDRFIQDTDTLLDRHGRFLLGGVLYSYVGTNMIFAQLLLYKISRIPPDSDLLPTRVFYKTIDRLERQGVPSRDITDLIRRYETVSGQVYDANLAEAYHLVSRIAA